MNFYFPYVGNKRQEAKKIDNLLNTEYDKIIEPFCGSCAISMYVYFTLKKHDIQYIENDIDSNLTKFYNIVKKEGSSKFYE